MPLQALTLGFEQTRHSRDLDRASQKNLIRSVWKIETGIQNSKCREVPHDLFQTGDIEVTTTACEYVVDPPVHHIISKTVLV